MSLGVVCCCMIYLVFDKDSNSKASLQGGIYIFQLVDWFIGSYTVTVIALLECVVMAWIYGTAVKRLF